MRWLRAFVVTRASTLSAAAMMMALPLSASAALGGDVSSVQSDRVKMSGALLRITATGSSTVHEIQASSGTVVREFISPAGKVFGVAWEGPWIPDLREMLGMYFEQYTTLAQAARRNRKGRGPISIQEPGLVVQMSGHARAFVGRAYVPQLLPQGVGAESVR
jgi:Protein of unknown function (DUF2844)